MSEMEEKIERLCQHIEIAKQEIATYKSLWADWLPHADDDYIFERNNKIAAWEKELAPLLKAKTRAQGRKQGGRPKDDPAVAALAKELHAHGKTDGEAAAIIGAKPGKPISAEAIRKKRKQ